MFKRKDKETIERQTDKIARLKSKLSRHACVRMYCEERLRIATDDNEDDDDPPDWLLHLWRKATGNFKGLPRKTTVPYM